MPFFNIHPEGYSAKSGWIRLKASPRCQQQNPPLQQLFRAQKRLESWNSFTNPSKLRGFFFLEEPNTKQKVSTELEHPGNPVRPACETYIGSSSGSQPSNSLKQKKHWAKSGSFSVGQWMKPAAAICKGELSSGPSAKEGAHRGAGARGRGCPGPGSPQ